MSQNILSRRSVLVSSLAVGGFVSLANRSVMAAANPGMAGNARDEKFWQNIATDYDISPDVLNLENGYWGIMARPVLEKYMQNTQKVNRQNSHYARRGYGRDFTATTLRVAKELGVNAGEIAITRGATEALQGLIGGYNKLLPGQAVMYADLDYYSMQAEMDTLAAKNDCKVVRLAIPEPVTHQGVLDFYRDALGANPQVRLLLLTHIGHRTGLMIPVRKIVSMARKMGVDVIMDAAHSFGQIDLTVDDLGADFIGFNLHKWIGAPIGAGVIYIRQNRLADISPNASSEGEELVQTIGRIHTGTVNFAAVMSVPDAFDYRHQIGARRIEARLRYLRSIWVDGVKNIDSLNVLTPEDDRLHAGITSFRVAGKTSVKDNKAIVETLLKEHGIFSVHRDGVAKGACVRITPAIYNSAKDMHRLTAALQQMFG